MFTFREICLRKLNVMLQNIQKIDSFYHNIPMLTDEDLYQPEINLLFINQLHNTDCNSFVCYITPQILNTLFNNDLHHYRNVCRFMRQVNVVIKTNSNTSIPMQFKSKVSNIAKLLLQTE